MKIMNTLVVAPHPDDEILGCGGIIKKLTSRGTKVFVLVVTRGKKELYSDERIENVRREALNAHKMLGVTSTRFFDFPAPDLDLVSVSELSGAIHSVIKEFEIGSLYLPHRGDIHHDHTAVFNAGLVAARPGRDNRVDQIFAYETLSETEWAAPFGDDAFIPTRFVDISAEFNDKLEAMRCFKSQLKEFPNPRSLKTIEALANFRGSTVGFTYAEAFMTIRIIDN
ncbi:MAG: PIG-L deacetylase family protein [Bacteroidales bacterium]|jgi:LmbE family N-acetylglucosaminyl deacetylase